MTGEEEKERELTAKIGKVRSSPNLALDHIRMAVMFAEKAKAIEDRFTSRVAMVEAYLDSEVEEVGEILSDPVEQRREYRFSATTSVIVSYAFVEACINELLYEVTEGGLESAFQDIPAVQIIKEHMDLRRVPTLKKYNLMLRVYEKPPFETGENPYQDVNYVKSLRDALMHHSPQFDPLSARDLDQYMGDKLHSKFSKSPLYAKSGLFFPYRCLSYGCAAWAIESCLNFTEEFYSRTGANKPYSVPETDIF